MIKRVLQFKWSIIIIFALTQLLVSWNKNTNNWYSNFIPERFTNSYFNDIIQNIKTGVVDTTIVLISGPEFNYAGDSIIGKLTQKISSYQPKVIALDYDFKNQALQGNYDVNDSTEIVLAAIIDESDSILYPVNIFNSKVHYGHVMGNGETFRVNNESIITLPEMVVSIAEPQLYKTYLERENATEIINYNDRLGIQSMQFEDVLSDSFRDGFFKNKIVLVGKTGSFYSLQPGVQDNVDVHETPIGTQFGVVILYNEIRTILGNFIDRSSLILDYFLIAFISIFNILFVVSLSHVNKKVLYIITKIQMYILIVVTTFVGVYFFDSYNFLFDYQSLCLTIILSTELSFWFTLK